MRGRKSLVRRAGCPACAQPRPSAVSNTAFDKAFSARGSISTNGARPVVYACAGMTRSEVNDVSFSSATDGAAMRTVRKCVPLLRCRSRTLSRRSCQSDRLPWGESASVQFDAVRSQRCVGSPAVLWASSGVFQSLTALVMQVPGPAASAERRSADSFGGLAPADVRGVSEDLGHDCDCCQLRVAR